MKIGLIGAGSIARVIAEHARGNYEIICVYDSIAEAATTFSIKYHCEILKPEDFPRLDLVIEAASQEAVREYAEKMLASGHSLMVMSIGAFVDEGLFEHLVKTAEKNKVKLIMPSGAIAGSDGIKAASIGEIDEVMLTTTKPPEGFGIDVKERTVLYEGPASEAVKKYPKNVNVAATLALVGIGFHKTKVRIVADPAAKSNRHEIYAKGEFGELRAETNNVPSLENPKTSYLAAMSAVAAIRSFKSSVVIG